MATPRDVCDKVLFLGLLPTNAHLLRPDVRPQLKASIESVEYVLQSLWGVPIDRTAFPTRKMGNVGQYLCRPLPRTVFDRML